MPHSTALVTLAIGELAEFKMSHPLFRRYAIKHGMDFVALREQRIRVSRPWFRRMSRLYFEKYQLRELLAQYDRIFYVDGDILVSPQCPNMFDLVPEGRFGCVFEDSGPDWWGRWKEIARAQRTLGPLPRRPDGYFNAGVMVVDRAHRSLFDLGECPPVGGRWPDQTTVNYHVARLELPIQPLDRRCNLLSQFRDAWLDPANRRSAWVIHYAGHRCRPLMAEDFPHVAAAWDGGGT